MAKARRSREPTAELSPAQHAEHLKRRKDIWAVLQNPDKLSEFGGRGHKGFASDTASKTGVDGRTVRRDVARAEALGDDIRAVVGTSLDKGVELDALAKSGTA